MRENRLEELLKLWRKTRAPEVAQQVDRLSVAGKRLYPKSATEASKEAAWMEAAASHQLERLPGLLELLHDGDSSAVQRRVEALDGWPEDPRIWSAYARLFEQPAHFHLDTLPLWEDLSNRLVTCADPRTAQRLEALAELRERWTALFRPRMQARMAALLEATRTALAKGLARRKTRPLTAAERAWVASSAPAQSLDDARAAVWEAPDDLSRRLVYADMLTAAGDPRGEFITLQCLDSRSAAQERRATELLEQFGKKWGSPLDAVGQVLAWERGFPAVVRVRVAARRHLSPVLGHAAWSTVHTIELGRAGGAWGSSLREVILHPSMTRVKRVCQLTQADVRALAKTGRSFSFLSMSVSAGDARLFALLTSERFPSLRHVHLEDGPGPTRAQVDFMRARPGIRVTFGSAREAAMPPDELEPMTKPLLDSLVAQVEQRERREQQRVAEWERAAALRDVAPTTLEVNQAVKTRDAYTITEVLERAQRAGDEALQRAAARVVGARLSAKVRAQAVAPVIRQLVLTPDQWVDLAEGGALLENNAIIDFAVGNARGASRQRVNAFEARARRMDVFDKESLRRVLARLKS